MHIEHLLHEINFYLVQPQSVPGQDGWFPVWRSDGTTARLLPLPGSPLDLVNTSLGDGEEHLKTRLRELTNIPRMSAFAMAAIIQSATAALCDDDAFVNVGLWQGFSFLSGIIGNPRKRCIGVDNFSQFDGPRDAFADRFDRLKGPAHEFFDMDYRKYFDEVHRGPIAFYIYDGEHSYANQLLGLQAAEPHFTDDCIIMVDDTNWIEPRRAVRDFVAHSSNSYRLLFDQPTFPYSGRLTFWNGCTVLQRVPSTSHFDYSEEPRRKSWGEAYPRTVPLALPDRPLVSLVLFRTGDSNNGAAAKIAKESLTYSNVEVIDVDPTKPNGAVQDAIDRSRGDFIAFLDSRDAIEPNTIGLALESGAKLARWIAREMHVAKCITELIPPGEKMILADEQQLNRQVAYGRECVPFPERNGRYWGKPTDSDQAIRELKRLQDAGARYFVLGWPTFWWKKHYPDFTRHLEQNHRQLVMDDNLIGYQLQ